MHKKKIIILVLSFTLLLFCLEERRPCEVLYSTVMTSSNLTEYKMTLVLHSLLPVDREQLAKEIAERHMRMNKGQPNPYYQLELYRTALHYRMNKRYDRLLVNEKGEIVTEIDESVFE